MSDSTPTAPRPDPGPIFQLATGYWASATLLTANELGLFAVLAGEAQPAATVARAAGTAEQATAMLLDSCAGLGLLTKTEGRYALTPLAAAFLVPGQPGYLGSALQWSRDQFAAWGQLATAVRQGGPVVEPALHLGDDPAQTRAFVVGMHERAVGVARSVTALLDLTGCRELLDVGGGPGTYATLLARKYPDLRVTVLDLPGVVAIARELIAAAGVSDRVAGTAGDATTGEYGVGKYDAVLFSGVLHQMSPATIQRMLAGAGRALRPGGRVIVSDVMVDATKTQPAFATLFSLQMLLTTREGAVFAATECVEWLRAAGFAEPVCQPLPPPLPYTVITAHRHGAR